MWPVCMGEPWARKRKHRAADPRDASTIWIKMRNMKRKIKTMLRTLHEKGGVEWYFVVYDHRKNYRLAAENSPGLQPWAEMVKAEERCRDHCY